jgi:simple sugar transport system ATP-binding protein
VTNGPLPIIEATGLTKYFGALVAVDDVSLSVSAGEIVCLLGDNGAGKSTVIKILSGLYAPDAGSLRIDGVETQLNSPADALGRGIATVYQDLAVLPLMSVTRNFFLGSEPTIGRGIFRRFDLRTASEIARAQMDQIGIRIHDTSQLVGTLSGGERQTLAIARAQYFGARLLILDEPTSALGVKEAAIVLRHVANAREAGIGVILITHNIQHALPVGDRFVILAHGQVAGSFARKEIDELSLYRLMGGGDEMRELEEQLAARMRRTRAREAAESAEAPGSGRGGSEDPPAQSA